jgi:type I restriction enzyme S subunit
MEIQFAEKELGECLELVIDHRGKTPKKLGADWVDNGIPTISAKNVNGGRLVATDEIRFVSQDVYKRWMKEDVKRGDCFLVSEGATLGECMMWDYDYPIVLGQRIFCLRANPSVLYSRYLYAYMTSASFQSEIIGRATGTSVDGLRQTEVLKLKLRLPSLTQQEHIGDTLYDLDKKIELNRRMNATLEAMARALFQSWFVDFDPVRAKLDGRKPIGLDATTAALFPEHLDDSALGHIPKGWTAGTVIEGFNLTMGQSPPGDTYNEDGNGLPFYQGRSDFGFRFPTRRVYCSAPTRYAKPGDTLVSVRAPVGDINMANEECCIGRGVAAVRHKTGATSFTYHSMENLYPDFARFEAEGTVFGSINKDSFEKLRFVIPPDEIVSAYERQAGPLDEQIRILENQSRTLATLRDTLLPKLLSGELSVAGAEKEVSA